jgi:hypothetical protein
MRLIEWPEMLIPGDLRCRRCNRDLDPSDEVCDASVASGKPHHMHCPESEQRTQSTQSGTGATTGNAMNYEDIKVSAECIEPQRDIMAEIEARQIHALNCKERDELAEFIGYDMATHVVFYPISFYYTEVEDEE